ncbi:hypothetical protein REJC140_00092 [Pseudorhizobium endolithicum]|uniref:Uncharacterized protein n=1 Tax=Pseudorhizobium endolithicum TaxID=1191678 RepID=A0ABN7JEK7_9HYPH|nr:hypothetical protein [Pseudorhizobium endolithicum]CAD7023097.1 hypothetical protein REJC140_00092 [Pseudorhizobium endolithicum]
MLKSPRIIGALAILIILALVVGWIWDKASDDALNQIERQNNEAGDASDDDRSRFDLCPDGMWDFGARKCRGPSTGGRD